MATEYLNNKTFESLIVKFQFVKKQRVKYQMLMDDIIGTHQRTMKRGKYQKPDTWTTTENEFRVISSKFQESQDELAIAFYTLSENIVRYVYVSMACNLKHYYFQSLCLVSRWREKVSL